MVELNIRSDDLRCTISSTGGTIRELWAVQQGRKTHPLLRQPASDGNYDASRSGCFPLVPFGNRVENNRFEFGGNIHQLEANTPGDPHYLHGDGWLGGWTVAEAANDRARLTFRHSSRTYTYRAEQNFHIDGRTLEMALSVVNTGLDPMPFGLGWHPFFPLTPQTTLQAAAAECWTEKAGWLPGERGSIPRELDFRRPRPLPRHGVNNGFEGWDGRAEIIWPERGLKLHIETEPVLSRYFVFVPGAVSDTESASGFFCFEPMTHSANGHNLPMGGGLKILGPGAAMSAGLRLSWSSAGAP